MQDRFIHDQYELLITDDPAAVQGLSTTPNRPMVHRPDWVSRMHHSAFWIAAREGRNVLGIVPVIVSNSRLPGFCVLRVERFTCEWPAELQLLFLKALDHVTRSLPRPSRTFIELYSLKEERLAAFGDLAIRYGYRRSQSPRCYDRTLVIDLSRNEDEIFSSFSKKARRDIRVPRRRGLVIAAVKETCLAPQIGGLMEETMSRTGGKSPRVEWADIIQYSVARPSVSRVVGLFSADPACQGHLVAFAWGRCHGETAEYSFAASTRNTALNLPLMYVLVWDLILWAKENGSTTFDMGGVTTGGLQDDDPLGGISDFKRYFSKNVRRVGDEWRRENSFMGNLMTRVSSFLSQPFLR